MINVLQSGFRPYAVACSNFLMELVLVLFIENEQQFCMCMCINVQKSTKKMK